MGFCPMLPLSHYSDLTEKLTEPSRERILEDLSPNMLVLGSVTSRNKNYAEILLEQVFATSKIHLHRIAEFKIYVKRWIGLQSLTMTRPQ